MPAAGSTAPRCSYRSKSKDDTVSLRTDSLQHTLKARVGESWLVESQCSSNGKQQGSLLVGKKLKGSKKGKTEKGPTLLDLPVELIYKIGGCFIEDMDTDLRTQQVVAADLINFTNTCKTLYEAAVRDVLWERFDATCPAVPDCPLDEDMEVIKPKPRPEAASARSSRTRSSTARRSYEGKRTTWEDVSETIHLDESMFSKESLVAALLAIGVPCSPYTAQLPALLEAAEARLVPKGCTFPLRATLQLRKEACTFFSKADAHDLFHLTARDLSSLEREEALALHGRGMQYRKRDVVMAAQRKFGTSEALRKKRARVEEARERHRQAHYRTAESQRVWMDLNGDQICPDCGLPYSAHL